jgi:hypothetical protein
LTDYFGVVQQVLVLDVVAAADHEHDGVIEWRFRASSISLDQLRIKVAVLFIFRRRLLLDYMIAYSGQWQVLSNESMNK